MTNKIQSLVTSRRFWVAVGGVTFVGFDTLGLGLSQDQALNVTIVIASWIFASSLKSGGKILREIRRNKLAAK